MPLSPPAPLAATPLRIFAAMRLARHQVMAARRSGAAKVAPFRAAIDTAEENTQLSNLDRTQEELAKQIETMEKVEHVNSLTVEETRSKIISSPYHQGARPFAVAEERQKALAGWFYHNTPKQKPEYWRAAERAGLNVYSPSMHFDAVAADDVLNRDRPIEWEKRNQVEGTASAGGDVVFPDLQFARNIDVALKWYGDIFKTSTVVDTPTGANLPYPLTDDTSHQAEPTAEAGTPNEIDMTFSQNTLSAYKYDSGFIKVSWELMTDSIIPLAEFIAKQSGIRMGRRINSDIIATGQGAGSNEIQNILAGMTLGYQSTSSDSAGPIYDDLVNMVESIDYAYQQEPGCGWLFSQNFRGKLRAMVDNNGRPLMMSSLEGIALGLPNGLLDYPYYINAAVPVWGHTGSGSGVVGNACAIFGDLKKIIIRRVVGGAEGGYNVLRLNERFADSGLVAFLTWGRFDAILSDAGQHPVKYLEAPNS